MYSTRRAIHWMVEASHISGTEPSCRIHRFICPHHWVLSTQEHCPWGVYPSSVFGQMLLTLSKFCCFPLVALNSRLLCLTLFRGAAEPRSRTTAVVPLSGGTSLSKFSVSIKHMALGEPHTIVVVPNAPACSWHTGFPALVQ